MDRPIQLLAVIPEEWRKSLTDLFIAIDCVNIRSASDWRSASAILNAHPEIEVALCASVLPDATWSEVLTGVSKLQRPPQVLIAARYADPSLWYDVLEVGAYDLIVYPFSAEVLSQAVLSASADCQFLWNAREQSRRAVQTANADPSSHPSQ